MLSVNNACLNIFLRNIKLYIHYIAYDQFISSMYNRKSASGV